MKTRLVILLAMLTALAAVAQPPARRAAQSTQNAAPTAQPAGSAYRPFPVAAPQPADAAWRRDVYRQLDLKKEANSVLYYPTVPADGRMNLYTYLFRQILRGQIKAYEYDLSGNENFSPDKQVKGKALMDQFKIFYESKDGRLRVNDVDLRSDEVQVYFVKESIYYDQHTSTFRTRITALCPVMRKGDAEIGGNDQLYPMFWVKYEDAAPYFAKLMLMGSSLNNAAQISADDFFTLGRYEGDIYKTTNLQDRILADYCPTDSALTAERSRIERELSDVQRHVWRGDSVPPAASDTLAADSAAVKPRTAAARRTTTTRRSTPAAKSAKTAEPKAAVTAKRERTARQPRAASSGAGFSVRRERH
ncbi:MAG: gliding motility protein GldN [Prevotellaceae bacterium]|nr:gliding motility protein GldN [Prevotellaceae bacterium]